MDAVVEGMGVQGTAICCRQGWHPKPGSMRSFAAVRCGEWDNCVIKQEEHQLFLLHAELLWVEVIV